MTENKEEKNVLKVLLTKKCELLVYNQNTKKLNDFYNVKPKIRVQFYVRTYFNGDNAKFVRVKTISDVPDKIDQEYLDSL